MKLALVIAGPPTGKGRPRFVRSTGAAITPKETVLAENQIRSAWQDAGCPAFAKNEPVALNVCVYVRRPASHFKRDGTLSAEGVRHPMPDNKKPDLDNAIKLILDALNKRAWPDDVQVVDARMTRLWTEREERTTIDARPALDDLDRWEGAA